MEGWLWFSNIAFNGQEPPLTLRWMPPSISDDSLTDPENAVQEPDEEGAQRRGANRDSSGYG